jgi:hypothetical protein
MHVLASALHNRGATGFTTTGLFDYIRQHVIDMLLLSVAGGMLLLANKGDYRQAMTRAGTVLVALFVLGLAVSGKADDIGTWLVALVTG